MHVPFAEVEEIMKSFTQLFQLWDNEAEKIQSIFRELGKKQKAEMKYSSRAFLQHKALETRLDELKAFRRQHEQLNNVILRVLRFSGGIMSLDNGLQTSPEKQVK